MPFRKNKVPLLIGACSREGDAGPLKRDGRAVMRSLRTKEKEQRSNEGERRGATGRVPCCRECRSKKTKMPFCFERKNRDQAVPELANNVPLCEKNRSTVMIPCIPSEDAARKLIYLAIRNYTETWTRASNRWSSAMPQFALLFGERFTNAME